MAYSRDEMETSIVWNDAMKTAFVYTASPVSMRKLDKLVEQFPAVYRRTWTEETDGRITAAKYTVDARLIRFGKPASEARIAAGKRAAVKMHSTPRTAL